jgi:hypothetical protein
MVTSPKGLGPKMTALARAISNCKRKTRPLVRESAPHQTSNCLTVTKIWLTTPDGYFIPRQTGRLTAGCNLTLPLTLTRKLGLNFSQNFLYIYIYGSQIAYGNNHLFSILETQCVSFEVRIHVLQH